MKSILYAKMKRALDECLAVLSVPLVASSPLLIRRAARLRRLLIAAGA